MDRERWVIKTTHNRYVGIPFILSTGFRSYLDDIPEWNRTKTYHSKEEAEVGLAAYLDPADRHYVDPYYLKTGEKPEIIERVLL